MVSTAAHWYNKPLNTVTMSASLKELTTCAPVTVKCKRTRIYRTMECRWQWSEVQMQSKYFCSNTVLLSEFHLWSKYMVSDYKGRRLKRAWQNCVWCIPFMFSDDACVITTWRLGLWAPLVTRTTWLQLKTR